MSSYPKRTSLDAELNIYWRKLVIEYDVDGDILYMGNHIEELAPDTDTSHMIRKFTLDANKNITKIQTLPGSWTDRTSLAWA